MAEHLVVTCPECGTPTHRHCPNKTCNWTKCKHCHLVYDNHEHVIEDVNKESE